MQRIIALCPVYFALVVLMAQLSTAEAAAPPGDAGAEGRNERQWENGLPTDSSFFPIAVWVQNTRNARRYKDLGVNVYVSLYRGPTQEQLDELERLGMYAITHQNERAIKFKDRRVIAGWMHGDEPDNAQSLGRGKGWGPPVAPEKIVANYERVKAADPTRPVLLNLGQGVAWDRWHGRGVRTNHPEDYPQYLKGCDIASFDIYPVTHDHPDVAGRLEFVGKGVERLRKWTDGRKPVWCCIETTRINHPKAMPTPAQLRAEVWIALTHGATGIIYFCHEFTPATIEAGLLNYPEQARAVKAVNEEIHRLAPVLNSPTITDGVRVTSSDESVPIVTLCKRHEGSMYVFAVSLRPAPTTATFAISGAGEGGEVEAINGGRTIPLSGGQFKDRFDGYAVHLYRVRNQ